MLGEQDVAQLLDELELHGHLMIGRLHGAWQAGGNTNAQQVQYASCALQESCVTTRLYIQAQ